MPELPEVETIRRDLERLIVGRTVASVTVLRASVLVTPSLRLRRAVVGQAITGLRRHGKVLVIDLAGGSSLLVHLRMTGRVVLCDDRACGRPDRRCRGVGCTPRGAGRVGAKLLPTYSRVVLGLIGGDRLVYDDCRALGKLEVCGTAEVATSRSLARFGPDALEEAGIASLIEALPRRRIPLKCLLLDQSVIAGIGNIYASEICHAARLRPDKPANALSPAEMKRLRSSTCRVLRAAVEARGTTFSDYRTGLGDAGHYAPRLKVYGREGERCRRRGCGGRIVRSVQQQRSTFYCPLCQR